MFVKEVIKHGDSGPGIIWIMEEHGEDDALKQLLAELDKNEEECMIIVCESEDWNGELSPWQAVDPYGGDDFSGNGRETIKWTEEEIARLTKEGTVREDMRLYIAGYSLAGLFSLWAFYESSLFDGAISCSGSLWYPGWLDYLKGVKAPKESEVYLSLGGKEEKTKNKIVASVGDATRETKRVTLEWNSGGHFTNPSGRIAKGIKCVLGQHAEHAFITKRKVL